ncbi:MAG: GNAT family N-acetyltransferase [Alphaproteobacteria bacterium]|nr:GNAT family N-acetyltransferase [Alphaproteobacteria bacterium]
MTAEYAIGWRNLWRMNVGDALDKSVIDHTERQLLDDRTPLFALLAKTDEDEIVGLLHGVVHPVAGSTQNICCLQDMYVHPARRNQGIGSKLLDALTAMGRAEKWDRVYWLNDISNKLAQEFSKTRAIKIDFTFHVLPILMLDKLGVRT